MNKKALYILPLLLLMLVGCSSRHTPDSYTLDVPELHPDYAGVTFAPNIAAPSFIVKGDAEAWQTEIGKCGAEPSIIVNSGADGHVEIPLKEWKELLAEAKGDSIYFRFAAKDSAGHWNGAVADVVNYVSPNPIDGYLAYRLLYPGYELWSMLGIYQRNLETYEQTPILENKDFGMQCVNCHNFVANSPEKGMMVHVRGAQGGTLVSQDGKVEKINSRFAGANHGATYPCWSRDGRFIAFSANDVGQVFHTVGKKPIEVLDKAADLMVYDVKNRTAYTDTLICGKDYIETFPGWSPDGKTLYFCRARGLKSDDFPPDQIRYDLCAIDFNATTCGFDNLRVLYAASEENKTVSFPRVSPDGRWLMFCRMDYGTFSIWHPEAQLCLMDLTTGEWREMDEVNSESIDSYHSWSTDGKWFVFSSKRMDGLWARPYFAAFDSETGRASKPFVMPQKKAEFYDEYTRTYNIPELINAPIENADALFGGIVDLQPLSVVVNR